MNMTQEELVKTIQNLSQEVAQLSIDKAHLKAKLAIAYAHIEELENEENK